MGQDAFSTEAGGLTVYGGPGGVVANIEELRAIEGTVARAQELFEQAQAAAYRAAQGTGGWAHQPVPETDPRFERAHVTGPLAQQASEIATGPLGPGAVAQRAAGLARDLAAARHAYEDAEAQNTEQINLLDRALLAGMAIGGPLNLLTTIPNRLLFDALFGDAVMPDGRYAADIVRDMVPHLRVTLAGFFGLPGMGGTGAATDGWERLYQEKTVETERVASRTPGRVPRGFEDLTKNVRDAQGLAGNGLPTILVDKLRDKRGKTTWMVTIPGMRQFNPLGQDHQPLDMPSALRSLASTYRDVDEGARGVNDVGKAVMAALAKSGAKPGEAVRLTGHSLGGITAANLAAWPAFNKRYRVKGIITFGSPIADFKIPRSTKVVALEHRQDSIAALSGKKRRLGPNFTTIARDLDAGKRQQQRKTFAYLKSGHTIGTYGDTARGLDQSKDVLIKGAGVDVYGDFDSAGGVTRYEYSMKRGQ
ncbi:MAG: hypothetical protein LBM66_02260 [Bifidobacteriaceae bacterium]|jgi:hypothetical protein|nr:hypothetical protein [Bifidobacteriaceae bacterium]